jgi:ribosomal protein L12E/L44/L45/RPP1/RPP2
MIEVAALMLCKIGGQSGSSEEIKAVLEAAGLEANDELITKLVGDVEGKDLSEILAEGMTKVKDIPLGGGGGGGGGSGGGGGGDVSGGGATAPAAEEEKEEEEMDLGGGMDMFGGEEGGGGGGDY